MMTATTTLTAETCSRCHKSPREDSYLSPVDGVFNDDGQPAAVCVPCRYVLEGLPPHEPIYPVGEVPDIGTDMGRRKLPVCGVCRKALRRGDRLDQLIRLAPEDLSDGGWMAYVVAAAPAWERHGETVAWAHGAYARETADLAAARDESVRAIRAAHWQACDEAELAAGSREAYTDAESRLKVERDRQFNEAELVFLAATGPARAARDNAIFKAGVQLRRELCEAMTTAQDAYTADPPTIEPGCYQVCSDCLGQYRPRVKDRLIRERVLRASDELTDNFLI